jgi:hypothetical protein
LSLSLSDAAADTRLAARDRTAREFAAAEREHARDRKVDALAIELAETRRDVAALARDVAALIRDVARARDAVEPQIRAMASAAAAAAAATPASASRAGKTAPVLDARAVRRMLQEERTRIVAAVRKDLTELLRLSTRETIEQLARDRPPDNRPPPRPRLEQKRKPMLRRSPRLLRLRLLPSSCVTPRTAEPPAAPLDHDGSASSSSTLPEHEAGDEYDDEDLMEAGRGLDLAGLGVHVAQEEQTCDDLFDHDFIGARGRGREPAQITALGMEDSSRAPWDLTQDADAQPHAAGKVPQIAAVAPPLRKPDQRAAGARQSIAKASKRRRPRR